MQKKVLLTLLATTPVAFAVNAAENLTFDSLLELNRDGDNWVFDGISNPTFGDNQVTLGQPGGVARINVAKKWNELHGQDYKMPQGDYILKFDVLNSAVIYINGQRVDNGATYKYDGNGTFEIEIKEQYNARPFTFGKASLQLKFDFEQAEENLKAYANYTGLETLAAQNAEDPNNVNSKYEELTSEGESLVEQQNKINENIASVYDESHSYGTDKAKELEYYLGVYNKYDLGNEDNSIKQAIDAINNSIKEFNNKVKAENDRYANLTANELDYESVQKDQVNTFATWYDEFNKEFDGNFENGEASNYVKNACGEELAQLKSNFDSFKQAVEEAYKVNGLIKDSEKVSENEGVSNALNEKSADLASKTDSFLSNYNKAVADQKAYNEWFVARKNLSELFARCNENLDSLNQVTYNNTVVYDSIVNELKNTNESLYNAAIAALQIKDEVILGADSLWSANDKKVIEDCAKELRDNLSAFERLRAAQEDAFEVANEAVEAAKVKVNTIAIPEGLSATEKDGTETKSTEELKAQKRAILNKIAEEKGKIDSEYLRHDLQSTDYDLTFVDGACNELNTEITKANEANEHILANNALIKDLQEKYEELEKYINETLFPKANAEAGTEDHVLAGKFDNTLANIKSSIDTFKAEVDEANAKGETLPATNNSKVDIEQNITDTKGIAYSLSESYNGCAEIITEWNTKYAEVLANMQARQFVKDGQGNKLESITVNGAEEELSDVKGKIDSYESKFLALPDNDNQKLYDEIQAIKTDLDTQKDVVIESLNREYIDYCKKVSKANYDAVKGIYDAVKNAFDNITGVVPTQMYPGKSDMQGTLISLNDVLVEQKEVIEKGAAATETPATPAELSVVDGELQGVYSNLSNLNPSVQDLQDNITTHNEIKELLGSVSDALANAEKEIAEKTTEPARSHWDAVLVDYKAEYDSLVDQSITDYNNIESAKNAEAIKDSLNVLNGKVVSLITAAHHNEAYHNAQLIKLGDLDKLVNEITNYINEKDLIPGDKTKYEDRVEDERGRIEELRGAVLDAFGKGESEEKDPSFGQTVDSIIEALEQIRTDLNDSYQNSVKEYNNTFLSDEENNVGTPSLTWTEWITELRQQYRKAINTYDEYYNSLQNAGYKEYVGTTITSHHKIYEYATKIENLISDVRAGVDSLNQQSIVIDADWLKNNAFDKALEIYNGMTGEVNDMTTAANAKAESYYTQVHDEKRAMLDEVLTTMESKGIAESVREKYTKVQNDLLNKAREKYNEGTAAGKLSVYMGQTITEDGKVVGGIANLLDQVRFEDINLSAAAREQWDNEYNAAKAKLDEYKGKLGVDYIYLSDERVDEIEAVLNAYKAAVENLNAEATNSETDLYGNLDTFVGELKEILDFAKLYDESVKVENNDNKQEIDVYQGLIADISECEEDFQEFKDWAKGMSVEYQQNYAGIEAAINEAKSYIEEHVGNLYDNGVDSGATDLINDVNELIEQGYSDCYEDEIKALNELANQARVIYNEAFAGSDASNNEYRKELDNIIAGIEALPLYTKDKKDESKTTLLDYQHRLCALINNIAESTAEGKEEVVNPIPGIAAAINVEYESVLAQLQEVQTLLETKDESVQTQFAENVSKQEVALAGVKTEIDTAGVNILALVGNINADLDAISAALTALTDDINAAQEAFEAEKAKQEASNAVAATLQDQLNEEVADYNKFSAFVLNAGFYNSDKEEFEYYKTMLPSRLASYEAELAYMQKWLDDEKAAYNLTAESEIPSMGAFVEDLDQDVIWYSVMESNYQINRTRAAFNVVELLIKGAKHANQAELNAELVSIQERVNNLETSGTIEGVNALVETVEAILTDIESLQASAIENAYIVGDINDDGGVDSRDVYGLIELVANRPVYDATNPRHLAADIDGNGNISINDAVLLINRILLGNAESRMSHLKNAPMASHVANIHAELITDESGKQYVEVLLDNNVEFMGGEFNIVLPAGMSIVDETLEARAEGMTLVTRDLENNTHRVVFVSQSRDVLKGSEGSILRLEVVGTGNVAVHDAFFSDVNGYIYEGTDPGTSGINSIYNSFKDGATRVYDAAGRMINKMQNGINIIVNGKGKGQKVYNKRK